MSVLSPKIDSQTNQKYFNYIITATKKYANSCILQGSHFFNLRIRLPHLLNIYFNAIVKDYANVRQFKQFQADPGLLDA